MMIFISRYFVLSAALIGLDALAEFGLSTAKPLLNEGLSVICELHGAEPYDKREGWHKMVYVSNPHRLVFKAAAATEELVSGEVYIEASNGERITTLSPQTFWLSVSSLEWKIEFGGSGIYYSAHVDIPDKDGLMYQDGGVKSFLSNCQFIKKSGLPPIDGIN